MQFLEPKLGKNCMNLVKKLLPTGRLTIIIISLVVRINGYQSQIKSAAGG
jgi:hypothetical protein